MVDDTLLDVLIERRILQRLGYDNLLYNLGIETGSNIRAFQLALERRRQSILLGREDSVYSNYHYGLGSPNPYLVRQFLGWPLDNQPAHPKPVLNMVICLEYVQHSVRYFAMFDVNSTIYDVLSWPAQLPAELYSEKLSCNMAWFQRYFILRTYKTITSYHPRHLLFMNACRK